MKIVVLDAFLLTQEDLRWTDLEKISELKVYQRTSPEQVYDRSKDAEVLLSNKVVIDRDLIERLPNLKCICVMATGYNNIDIQAAKDNNIVVCNAAGYSTDSVAQHVFASIFAILNRVENYTVEAKNGVWSDKGEWSYTNETILNLNGLTLGIIGFGQIGRKVSEIGKAFGMKIVAHHKHPERDKTDGVSFVDLNDLYATSDIVTLHVPLNSGTKEMINSDSLNKMKKSAILVNTGRGGLINESDLVGALKEGAIRAAALDVMVDEPPHRDHPLLRLDNCFITPHVAWSGFQARQQLMEILIENVQGFQSGKLRNRVA